MRSHDFLRKRIPFFKKIATNIIHCNVAFTIDEMDILYLVKLRPQSAARKKLVATANRREGACNRTEAPSVTFCVKGGARERADGLFLKSQIKKISRSKADFAPTWLPQQDSNL